MKINHVGTLCLVSLCLLVFSGCASTWSQSQQTQLASVSVAMPVTVENPYHKPDAKDSPGMSDSLTRAMGGGLIPSLLGSAIDASVTTKQQNKYDAANGNLYAALGKAVGAPPLAQLQTGLKSELARHSFFGTRLSDQGKAVFTLEVQRYGLQISPATTDPKNILLRLRITTKVTLKLPDGKVLWESVFNGVAGTAKSANAILEDPSFIPTNIDEAIHDLCYLIFGQLDPKLGLKPREDYSRIAREGL